MRTSMRSAAWIVAVALALQPIGLEAQSNTSSVMLNVHLSGAQLSMEGADSAESGIGFGVRLGWGVTKNMTLFVSLDTASIKTADNTIDDAMYGVVQGALGGLWNFRPGKSLVPYLEAGLSNERISGDITVIEAGGGTSTGHAETTGLAFMYGGGINYFFARTTAINVGLNISTGHFKDFEVNGIAARGSGFDAVSTRISLGLTWYPARN